MADEIKPEVIKKTQDVLGKFIKKPVLTEKLLTKPPFRFLHDICTAAMRETGFFEGVLTPSDCKVDNIKDKDGKIAFLVKVIGAVEAANGIKLAVRPNKVVAGHEPARTNEFLQALGKALENQVKNANVTQSKPDPKPDAKSEPNQSQAKTTSKTTKKSEKEDPSLKKKSSSTKVSRTEKTSGSKDPRKKEDPKSKAKTEKISPRTKEDQQKKTVISPRSAENNTEESKTEESERTGKREEQNKLKSSQAPSTDSSDVSVSKKSKSKTEETNEDVKNEPEQLENKRPISARPGHRKPVVETTEPAAIPQSLPAKETERPESTKTITKSPSDAPKRPEGSFRRLSKENIGASPVPPSYPKKDSDAIEESSPVSRPVTSIRPTTGRPASARPAAPRIRDRGEITVHEDVVKQSTGNVAIIIDNKEGPELEDENVVTVEPENDLVTNESESTDQIDPANDQNTNQGESGLLVNQILETQKELNQSRLQILDNKSSGKTEIEWKSGRNREATDREIKKLRLCIQTLTRSVNPLGKLLDFLQEDVDVMQKELTTWKEMNSNLDMQIDEERSLTEQSVEPLKVHLKELQQSIEHQLDQMTVVKANILRNDTKIQRLLTEMK